jgi:hypothetical protein
VAYRQLFAVALVISVGFAAACGGDAQSTVSENDPHDQLASSADDQAPRSSDAPPPSADDPPLNPDQPGGTSSSGEGGGQLVTICQQLCDRIAATADCTGGIARGLADACDDDCQLPEGAVACEAQATAAYACLASLDDICSDDALEDPACAPSFTAYSNCVNPRPTPSQPQPGNGNDDNGGAGP